MIKPLFFGRVEGGRVIFDAPAQLSLYLNKFEGKEIQATIEPKRKPRSRNENNYYFGVVVAMLGEHFGYEKEEMHEALKMLFLKVVRPSKPTTVKSTTDLSTVEMEEYLSKIRMWASVEWGVNIPEPNEVDWAGGEEF